MPIGNQAAKFGDQNRDRARIGRGFALAGLKEQNANRAYHLGFAYVLTTLRALCASTSGCRRCSVVVAHRQPAKTPSRKGHGGRIQPQESISIRVLGWARASDIDRSGVLTRNFGIWRANGASTVMIWNPGCQLDKRMNFDDQAMRAHCRSIIRVLSRPTTKAGVRCRPAGRTPKENSLPP